MKFHYDGFTKDPKRKPTRFNRWMKFKIKNIWNH